MCQKSANFEILHFCTLKRAIIENVQLPFLRAKKVQFGSHNFVHICSLKKCECAIAHFVAL